MGSLLGHAVWKAVDFDIISYKKTVLHLSEIQVSWKILLNLQIIRLKNLNGNLKCSVPENTGRQDLYQ